MAVKSIIPNWCFLHFTGSRKKRSRPSPFSIHHTRQSEISVVIPSKATRKRSASRDAVQRKILRCCFAGLAFTVTMPASDFQSSAASMHFEAWPWIRISLKKVRRPAAGCRLWISTREPACIGPESNRPSKSSTTSPCCQALFDPKLLASAAL